MLNRADIYDLIGILQSKRANTEQDLKNATSKYEYSMYETDIENYDKLLKKLYDEFVNLGGKIRK